VPLALKNNFAEKIESARAAVFLLDPQGKMVGRSTKWVIGGSEDRPGLAAGATNAFHFVITSNKPFTTTNLTAKVSFNRVVLEGGKLGGCLEGCADPAGRRLIFRLAAGFLGGNPFPPRICPPPLPGCLDCAGRAPVLEAILRRVDSGDAR
jgi:hypothetical protein